MPGSNESLVGNTLQLIIPCLVMFVIDAYAIGVFQVIKVKI